LLRRRSRTALRKRAELADKHNRSLRELYRGIELPGENPLKVVHAKLDEAARSAYRMPAGVDPLPFLFKLNAAVVDAEKGGKAVEAPGLPSFVNDRQLFVTKDAIIA
jgi:hypothetical protein